MKFPKKNIRSWIDPKVQKYILASFVLCICLTGMDLRAQETKSFQIHPNQVGTFNDFFHLLEDQYGIVCAYPTDLAQNVFTISSSISSSGLESLLHQLFKYSPIEYEIVNPRKILIRHADPNSVSNRKIEIAGKLFDKEDGSSVPFATIALDTLNYWTTSDSGGSYSLFLPSWLKWRTVQIRCLGYESLEISVQEISEKSSIILHKQTMRFGEILVTDEPVALNVMSKPELIQWNYNGELTPQISSGIGEDVVRELHTLPGIASFNDDKTDLLIRGSTGDETLILLDGIPLHRIDHFYGIFSSISPLYIDKAEVYKSTIPARYNFKSGGMVHLSSHDPMKDIDGEIDLNILSSSFHFHSPVTAHLGISLNGRVSHTDLTQNQLFSWLQSSNTDIFDNALRRNLESLDVPNFKFHDFNGKLVFEPSGKHHFQFNIFSNRDRFINDYEQTYVFNFKHTTATFQEDYYHKKNWNNLGLGANYTYKIDNHWSLNADWYSSESEIEENIFTTITRDSVNVIDRLYYDQDLVNRNNEQRFDLSLLRENKGSKQLNLGYSYALFENELSLSEFDRNLIDENQNASEHAFYSDVRVPISNKLNLQLGARYSWFSLTNSTHLSPGLSVSYEATNQILLKGSINKRVQFSRNLYHENRLGESQNIYILSNGNKFPVSESLNFMIGGSHRNEHWLFDLELYSRDLDGVLEHASVFPGANNSSSGGSNPFKIYSGTGKVLGMDALLQYSSQNYRGTIAYTLSKSTHMFEEIFQNTSFPAQDDRRHQLNITNSIQSGDWSFDMQYAFASGRPYVDVSKLRPRDIRDQILPEDRLTRLPDYHRIDLGIHYHINLNSIDGKIGLSVLNATNHNNVKYIQNIYTVPVNSENGNKIINQVFGNQASLLPRTLNFNLNLNF